MRSSVARRRNVAVFVDTAIALACVLTAAYFIIVIDFCVGHDELANAELLLLGAKIRTAHSALPTTNNNKHN